MDSLLLVSTKMYYINHTSRNFKQFIKLASFTEISKNDAKIKIWTHKIRYKRSGKPSLLFIINVQEINIKLTMSAVTQLEEGGGVGSIPVQAKKLV